MQLSVEEAVELDIPDWVALAAEVGDLFGADMANDPAFRQALRRSISADTAFCVRIEQRLVGAMLFKSGSIHWLAVLKRYRRHGVARALVSHAVSAAAEVRVTTFGVAHPHPDAPAARGLYRELGFQLESEVSVLGPDGTPRETLVWRSP